MFIFYARQHVGVAVGIVTGLVNQKLLPRMNTSQPKIGSSARICMPVCSFPMQSARPWLRSASGLAERTFSRSPRSRSGHHPGLVLIAQKFDGSQRLCYPGPPDFAGDRSPHRSDGP
jgi:hypothetical protein